jgi:hypothetical protein
MYVTETEGVGEQGAEGVREQGAEEDFRPRRGVIL